ncbi:MAG: phospholipid carrier-dependent glycosyltransferase [Acidobacteria bacterium]|nr:phospholipid carrier-dependent glycosyltransferase [Acidobacteriota bacterium]
MRSPAFWILPLITGIGLAVRLWGIDFGLPHVLARPDELLILSAVIKMHDGRANPGFFDYPGLYMYLVAGLYALYYGGGRLLGGPATPAAFVKNFYEHWEPYFLIPRVFGAVLGAATIAIVHGIGRAVLSRSASWLAALFTALAFLHVRDSHYATTDVTMTFFVMGALLATLHVYNGRAARDAWLAGALAGCAVSAKYNAVFIVLPMAVVEALHAWDHRRDWRRMLRETHIVRMATASALIFGLTNPYLFLDFTHALNDLRVLQASTGGGMTPPEMLGRGWTYHLPYSLWHGLGAPLLAAGLAGMLLMAVRLPRLAAIFGAFPLAYYAAAGAGHNVFVRYMIPVVPFLCIFAGYAVSELAGYVARWRLRGREPLLAGVLGLAVIAPSAVKVARFDYLLAQEDNRLVAARWVHTQVPADSLIFMSGNLYGRPQLERGPVRKYRYLDYDYGADTFTLNRRPTPEQPDWIIVQRSGIPYSHIAPRVVKLLETDYSVVHTLSAADLTEQNFYDIQDGFYAAFGSFRGVRRFGPNFEIYRRRATSPAR